MIETESIAKHLAFIEKLFDAADSAGIMIWLENGWAIDARLGRVTRPHGDIDLAYAHQADSEFKDIIRKFGFDTLETTPYGFVSRSGDIVLDCEPCFELDGDFAFPGYPAGSCPREKQGVLAGRSFRCVSWEALYFEFLGYVRDIPLENWRSQDIVSMKVVEAELDERIKERLKRLSAER
jgi:aminoglycoside 2''-adenylyltransferase